MYRNTTPCRIATRARAMSARAAVLLALVATALPPACAMRTPALVAAKTRSSDAVLATGTKAAHDAARKVSLQEMEQALGIFGGNALVVHRDIDDGNVDVRFGFLRDRTEGNGACDKQEKKGRKNR